MCYWINKPKNTRTGILGKSSETERQLPAAVLNVSALNKHILKGGGRAILQTAGGKEYAE